MEYTYVKDFIRPRLYKIFDSYNDMLWTWQSNNSLINEVNEIKDYAHHSLCCSTKLIDSVVSDLIAEYRDAK